MSLKCLISHSCLICLHPLFSLIHATLHFIQWDVYYGTSATVPMMGRNVIGSTFDARMLTYESLTKQDKGSGKGMLSTTSFSLGLTRHHFVTLSSVNDVKFVNRVAKKVIQEEPRSYRKNESTWYLSPQLRKLGLMCSGMRGCCSGSEEE